MPQTRPAPAPDPSLTAAAWLAGVICADRAIRPAERPRAVPRSPFPSRSANALAWRRGFKARAEQLARQNLLPDRTGAALGIVPCETPDETIRPAPPARVGRGRSRSGPRREWLEYEKRLAWACQAVLSRREIAALLPGRDCQAVKNQLHRMKRKAAP